MEVKTDFAEGKIINRGKNRTACYPFFSKHIEMDLKWNPGRIPHLASAAVWVTDLSWRGNLNPSPRIKDDRELLMDEYLSPRKLVSRHPTF